jgi:hydrogenase maturation protease
MRAPVVVFAIGNPSRGDDALGPLIAARWAAELEQVGLQSSFELIDDFQLQIEHALDLQDRSLALFIDAGTGTSAPYSFRMIRPGSGYGHTTHALEPEAVLQVFQDAMDGTPPPAFLLCVRGESFELGEGLTPDASSYLEASLTLLRALAANPTLEAWSGVAESSQR